MGSLFIQLVLLVGVHVTARPVKDNGKPWDAGGPPLSAPDLRVSVYADGVAIAGCDGPQDTLTADCELADRIDVAEHAAIEVRVVDRDLVNDDAVGVATFAGPYTAGTALPIQRAGQLSAATIELADGPSLVRAMLWKVLAVIGGMGVGGLVVFALRDRIFPPVQPPVVAPDGASMVVAKPVGEGRTRADELLYIAATVGAAIALFFAFTSPAPPITYGAGAFAAVCAIASIVASKVRANRLRG